MTAPKSKRGGARPNSGGSRLGAGRKRKASPLVLVATRVPAEQHAWLAGLARASGATVAQVARLVIGLAYAKRD